jgi:hypothetical protein
MLTDLNEKQLKKTRYISRYLPIQKTCQSNLSDIENVGKELFPPYFDQKDNEGNLLTKKVKNRMALILFTHPFFISLLLFAEFAIVTS